MAEDVVKKISKRAGRAIGWYVYLYADPRDGHVFYVGKGRGNRALAHLRRRDRSEISRTIKNIRKADLEPQIEVLAHGLKKEEDALRVESSVIDLLGLPRLDNRIRGLKSGVCGRVPWSQLESLYGKGKTRIVGPAILIRINQLYRYGMSPADLYDSTRGIWKVNVGRAKKARYAFAVFKGVVREVYEIAQWFPAGTTFSGRGDYLDRRWSDRDRWEFVGKLAPPKMRKKYVGRDVNHYFPPGSQNPIKYVEEAAP